jgi:uncharacterized membrane protein YkvA (DUF1232 family)
VIDKAAPWWRLLLTPGRVALTETGMSPDTPIEGEVLTPDELKRREAHVRQNFWAKLKSVIRRVPFAKDLVAAFYCATDPETPLKVKAVLLGALAYFIMPIDVVPDVLVGLGLSDDAAVLAVAIKLVADAILPRHRAAAEEALREKLETGSDAKPV